MWRPVAGRRPFRVACVSADDLVDAEASEGTFAAGDEDGHHGGWLRPSGLEHVPQQLSRLRPEGTAAPLVALAVEPDTGLVLQVEVRDAQVGDLLHASAGVVEQQQESTVAEGEGAVGREPAEKLRDLFALEEMRLGRRGALDSDRRDPLGGREAFGTPPREKLEEGPQDRKSMVSGSPVIVPLLLQMLEEALYALGGHILGRELRQATRPVVGYERQEEPQPIPVCPGRGGSEALLERQLVHEERVQQRTKRRCHRGTSSRTSSAHARNRSFAWLRSSGVIVR